MIRIILAVIAAISLGCFLKVSSFDSARDRDFITYNGFYGQKKWITPVKYYCLPEVNADDWANLHPTSFEKKYGSSCRDAIVELQEANLYAMKSVYMTFGEKLTTSYDPSVPGGVK